MKTICRKVLRALTFMMMIIVGTIFLSVHSVGAKSSFQEYNSLSSNNISMMESTNIIQPTYANWVVDVDFEFNQINADWIVRVWGDDSTGDQVLLIEQQIPLNCETHGNMLIVDEQAILDGVDDHFTCDLPSFANTVATLTNGEVVLPSASEYQEPWAEVNAILHDSEPYVGNPIFYIHPHGKPDQPDMQFYAPNQDNMARLYFFVNNEKSISGIFDASSTSWNPLRSEVYYGEGSSIFRHWSNGGLHTQEPAPNIFSSSTKESTLYIGYSPAYNTYFKGKILNGSLDPGCFPH